MPSVRLSIALVTVVVGGFALCATAEYYSHEVSDDETMDDGGRPPAGSDGDGVTMVSNCRLIFMHINNILCHCCSTTGPARRPNY